MMETGRQKSGSPSKSRRKRLLAFLKVILALAILLVILAQVKVRDHLILPEGTPHAGTHAGWIRLEAEGDPGQTVFEKEGLFRFEAVRSEGRIVSAVLIPTEGSPYRYGNAELDAIVLREGLVSVVEEIHVPLWSLSILIYFLAISITTVRWGLLLRAADLPQTMARAFKLTFMGIFFNNVVPGQTGGDWVRAYYIARENRKRKTDSIITVIMDRGLGITALAFIAAAVIPFDFSRYAEIAAGIYGFVGLVLVAFLVYYSKRLRRFLKLDVLLRKLPFQELFQKVDRSIFLYRYRKSSVVICFLLSFVVHFIIILSLWILGRSLGIKLGLVSYYVYIPIIFILSSLPITPAGWGVGEALFVGVMAMGDVMAVKAMALSLVFRLNMSLISMLGGLFLLLERDRVRLREMDLEDMVEEREEAPPQPDGVGPR